MTLGGVYKWQKMFRMAVTKSASNHLSNTYSYSSVPFSPYSAESSTHIIFVQGGCVLISIAPQSSSHLSARDMEPMAVTYEAAAPTPLPLSKCDEITYFGKKYLYFQKEVLMLTNK